MKYENFVRKLKKRLGDDIDIQEGQYKDSLVYKGTVLSWRKESDGHVRGFHTKGVGQEACLHTDYFPGTWWDNATQMINSVCPPPPKFSAGQYVRFKNNKRNHRAGVVGQSDLVVGVAGQNSVELMTLSRQHHPVWGPQRVVFAERDLELVEE